MYLKAFELVDKVMNNVIILEEGRFFGPIISLYSAHNLLGVIVVV